MNGKLSLDQILYLGDKKKPTPGLTEKELARLLDLPEPEKEADYSHILDLPESKQIGDDPVSKSMELNISKSPIKTEKSLKQLPEN